MENVNTNTTRVKLGKIYLGWIFAGLAFLATMFTIGGFMAGAAYLFIVMTFIILVFAAPIHFFLAKKNKTAGFIGHLIIAIMTFVIMVVIFFVLALSGMFNFV